MTDYKAAICGRVGIYAENVASGARLEWRADERFVMCSTFKASLAAMVLSRVDRGADHLNLPITYTAVDIKDRHAPVAKANLARGRLSLGAMCRAAVEESDNTCANLLLARVGGPIRKHLLSSAPIRAAGSLTKPSSTLSFQRSGDLSRTK